MPHINLLKLSSLYGWIPKLLGIYLLGFNQVHIIDFQLCLTQNS
jgi:hypothetical protein